MEPQTVINILAGMLGGLFGWLLKQIFSDIKEIRHDGSDIHRRVNAIEVLVAGEYIKRSEFDQHMLRLFNKLDAIESKLNDKADR